jgi:hypothetical protein
MIRGGVGSGTSGAEAGGRDAGRVVGSGDGAGLCAQATVDTLAPIANIATARRRRVIIIGFVRIDQIQRDASGYNRNTL